MEELYLSEPKKLTKVWIMIKHGNLWIPSTGEILHKNKNKINEYVNLVNGDVYFI